MTDHEAMQQALEHAQQSEWDEAHRLAMLIQHIVPEALAIDYEDEDHRYLYGHLRDGREVTIRVSVEPRDAAEGDGG